jgi:hypothetical protein
VLRIRTACQHLAEDELARLGKDWRKVYRQLKPASGDAEATRPDLQHLDQRPGAGRPRPTQPTSPPEEGRLMSINPLIARFAGEPALIAHGAADRFRACLRRLSRHPQATEMLAERAGPDEDFWPDPDCWQADYRPYVVVDGILQIPVKGVLLHNFPYALGGWATGYDYIWRAFQRGCGDYATGVIKGIALVRQPGGMVAGCFDAVDKMVALKAATPAFPCEPSPTNPPTRRLRHLLRGRPHQRQPHGRRRLDRRRDHAHRRVRGDEEGGYKITFIFSGKHKVDGNPYEPLPADVKRASRLASTSSTNLRVRRGAKPWPGGARSHRETEGLTFGATQAVSNGLADSIGTLDDALAAYVADLSST